MANKQHASLHWLSNSETKVKEVLGRNILPANANAGLVYDRYLPVWDSQADQFPKAQYGFLALKDFVEDYNKPNRGERRQVISSLQERQQRSFNHLAWRAYDHWECELKSTSRLVMGMGADHPLENGFGWHDLYGVPYLPATALKGLIRATAKLFDVPWAEEVLGKDHDPEGGAAQTSLITVFDAFPTSWPALAVDIINSHHPKYYKNSSEDKDEGIKLPVETESPVPVCFLTIEAGVTWRMRIMARKKLPVKLSEVGDLACEGLQCLGIGGKTAVGYGRMAVL